MNKKGDFVGLFVFIILTFVIVLFSAIFIYMGQTTEDQLKATLGNKELGGQYTANETIDLSIGKVNEAYDALYWIALFLIIAQIFSILIGSFLVRTHPVFFVGYIFLMLILIIVSVAMSNAYEVLANDPTLGSTLSNFIGANEILLNLPFVITIIGFVGGIIMYSQIGRNTNQ